MELTVQIWLFGGIYGIALIFAGFAYGTAQRLMRLETYFEVFGKTAAKILHSPHTAELDAYLDKYMANTMGETDWTQLLRLVDALENDTTKPKEERGLAAIVGVHCRKRLGMPLPNMHHHTEETTTK